MKKLLERPRPHFFSGGPQPAIGAGTGLQKFLAGLQSGQSATNNLPSQTGNGQQQGNMRQRPRNTMGRGRPGPGRPGPGRPGSGRPRPEAGRLQVQPGGDYVAYNP